MRNQYEQTLFNAVTLLDNSFSTILISWLKYFRSVTSRLVWGRRIQQKTMMILAPESEPILAGQPIASTADIVSGLTVGRGRVERARRLDKRIEQDEMTIADLAEVEDQSQNLTVAEFLAANKPLLAFQPRAAYSNRHPAIVLPGLSSRPQPPHSQQFFAQNYYRPAAAAPRPLPHTPHHEQRLNAVHFPDDLVPEAFKCELLFTVMRYPVRLPQTNQICDGVSLLAALARKPENPFNRQPMTMEDAKAELELKNKISDYVDYVVEQVQNKQKEQGQQTLARADYEAIHQAAMSRLEPQNQPAAAPKNGR